MRQRLRFTGIALIISAALALLFISVYAVSGRNDDGSLQGRVLIWHAYSGTEAEAFDEMIGRFRNIHPNVTVMQQAFAGASDLQEEYVNAVAAGLGPDVIVAPSSWIATLAPAGHIAPVTDEIDEDSWQRYTSTALDTVTYNQERYALPLALNTLALYYNRQVVSNTVSTTDGLEREAAQGAIILMSTTFRDAYWGINAFGGRVFDDEARVVLDQGGFANWLAWLANLRNYPGVILDNNRDALRNRFIQGDAAFYIGYASELNQIGDELGLENIGVGPLPAGPIANAQPLLEVTGFLFSPVSSGNQRRLALELTQFLSNAEQSGALMRRVRSVPANQRVRINPRLNPIVSSFATQSRASASLLNSEEMLTALRLGGDAYLRVLDGGIAPAEAAMAITAQINEANGIEGTAVTESACANLGTVRLLHTWEGEAEQALERIIQRFRAVCPLIIVDAQFETPAGIRDALQASTPGITRGFTVLGSPELFQFLMPEEQPLLREVSSYVSNELLQRFQPNALDTMRFQRTLYGLPLVLELDALYYNRELVNAPPLTLDDLRAQAGQSVPVELDVNFERALWGATAFGSRLFDNDYRLLLDQGGMDEWLAWLRESRESFGIGLSTDSADLRSRFESGQLAYYVGRSTELHPLEQSLGSEVLGVAALPDGPGGNALPLLSAQGFLFSRTGTDLQIALALEFIQFATNVESQTFLAQNAELIPVNANVELINGSPVTAILEISRNALAPPNTFHMQTVRNRGDEIYQRVLQENENPADVVSEVTRAVNEENGVAPLPAPEPTPALEPPTPDNDENGALMLEGEDPDESESKNGNVSEQAANGD